MSDDLLNRQAALACYERILDQSMALDGAFDEICRQYDLSSQNRSFVRFLITTALRRRGHIVAMINFCTPRNLGAKQNRVKYILELGITQLLFMDVPAYAAINSAVEMTARQKEPRLKAMKNMVNAILRRIDRERDEFLSRFSLPGYNLPRWIRESWAKRFGTEVFEQIALALLAEPPLDISLKPSEDPEAWAKKLSAEVLPTGSLRLSKAGNITDLAGFDEGVWWVQDLAASLPAKLLGAGKGDRVLDLCAAPGGKTAQSAAKECVVTAVDQSKRRIRRLSENMERLNLSPEIVQADATSWQPQETFPFILLDAPCSSSGTLRRHPDMAWTKGPQDVRDLAALQERIIQSAIKMLSPGGVMIYCVCSVEAEEGPDQMAKLLKEHSEIRRKPITADELPGLEMAITPEGDVQTLPHYIDGGMDGFYICRLIKEG